MNEIAVVLATYNGERYLLQQLVSINDQSLKPSAIYISDDGSTDQTLVIAQQFKSNSRIPVHIRKNTENLGYGNNFLEATTWATEEFIAWSDQDDVWLPQKLEVCYRRLIKDRSLLAMHRSTYTDKDLNEVAIFDQGIVQDEIVEGKALFTVGQGNSMVFKRDLVTLIPHSARPKRAYSHDHWVYALAAALGRISHIEEPLCLYRQHDSNTIGVISLTKLEKLLAMLQFSKEESSEKILLVRQMEHVLKKIALSGPKQYRKNAADAAERYALLALYLEARLTFHAASWPFGRGKQLLPLYASSKAAGLEPSKAASSMVKDVMVGFGGVSLLAHAVSTIRAPRPNC